ncbi:MAG: META domain-containing protein, partial [Caldilineaceae bacterium]|nr:META domain-containing protein [Caldilineaceae bacterium]
GEAATDGEATADGEAVADGAEVGAVDETEGTEVVEELITNTWVLTSINKQNALGGWPVTALWSSDGTVIGSSGCNYYNTNAAVEGDSISFTVPTSTRMMCPSEAVMLQENIFLGALGNVTTFSDTGLELILSDDTGDLEIRFTSLAAMEATSWLVESYMDSTGAEVDIAADSAITANFENNTLSGNDGCANYQSQYSVDGEIIFFLPPEYSPAGTDAIECATGDVREQQARDYEIALQQARLYEFRDDSLNLYDDQHDLVISYRAVTE